MQSSLWKLAVITGVVALCLLVIDHAREDMANSPQDVAENEDTKVEGSSEGDSENDFLGYSQSPAAPHEKTDDAVSHVGHLNDNSEEYPHLAQTGAAVPVVNPFGDDEAVEPRPLGEEGLPLSGQGEPAAETIVEAENTVPELWDDPPEAEVAADTDVVEPLEEIPAFDETEVESSIGIFDAAAAASTEEAATDESATEEFSNEEEIVEIVPEELPATGDDFLVDESTEPLAMPTEAETETAITEIDPFETSSVEEPVVETVPAVETELYDFASEETDPFADDVSLPTAGDEDAPLDEVQLDATELEEPTEELLPLADDFADDNAVEVIEPFEPADLTGLEEVEAAEASPESPELTELPLDDTVEEIVVEEPAMEEPAGDTVLEYTEDPPSFEPEEMSADDFSESLPAVEEPAVITEEPFEARELAAEEVNNETPPLPSFPETDVLEPEAMLTDEIEPVATEATDSDEGPVTVPAAEPGLIPEVEETFTETLEEPAEELAEESTPELIAEPEPELLPTETVPAQEPKVEVSPTDTDAVESQPAADENVVNEEVIGEGTIDADSPRGEQRPQLTIDKQSPPTAVLGKPFIYSILIKNVGQSPAGHVTVEDEIPRGAKLTGTIPQAELVGKKLIWKFGTLQPNQERKISIRVIPIAEGPIGSVATVNFVAEVAAQTVVQKPELKVSINAPKEAPLGKPVVFQFKVTNLGTMVAKKVVLRDILPSHFTHPGGKDLEYEIGDLAGGQTRDVQLTLTAAEIGAGVNQAIVTADGDISIKAEAEVKILDQGISISREGPKSRLLRRATSFTNSIRNKAKSPVNDLVVVEQIPEGMKFLKASQGGNFDPQKKTVTWHIQQIAAEESEDVSVMLLPEAPGTKESVIRVFGESGQIGSTTTETAIRGFALLDIKISQADQPVVIGERVSYRIEIQNRGTEAATGVLVSTLLPEEMEMVNIKGPLEHQQTKQQIDFSPIADLAPNQHISVDLLLEAKAPGDTRLHVQVQSDQMKKPLSRETATVIFGEQN
ncbi:Large cysteine-rich periplasmic protein OmcB [Symmachiella macrocystis]|uniref:Large cysteine-rich periplasmic protein OmcB n=2 Tax=Symmachiella macrocystis TaxID=2527985 RepID=A0A5C6B5P4_9PLAN|nr:Large cysteine-rich periplasmic protein OmcB [Symmachiella macrocystis]